MWLHSFKRGDSWESWPQSFFRSCSVELLQWRAFSICVVSPPPPPMWSRTMEDQKSKSQEGWALDKAYLLPKFRPQCTEGDKASNSDTTKDIGLRSTFLFSHTCPPWLESQVGNAWIGLPPSLNFCPVPARIPSWVWLWPQVLPCSACDQPAQTHNHI